MRRVWLDGKGDFDEWRMAARGLLINGVPPDAVEWRLRDEAGADLFAVGEAETSVPEQAVAPLPSLTVPRAFMTLAEAVICHSDPARLSLLYRTLHRLQGEPDILAIRSDADVAALNALEKSVRRDCHKMTAFVRFKEVDAAIGATRRRFVAWFEPDHHIVVRTAPFFQRRFTDMDWVIATPKGAAAWDGKVLHLSTVPADNPMLTDATDELWRTYFANIFNPVRLKVKAMQAEMPKKYWKNLPEAGLIPAMIAGAEASVVAMAERAAQDAPLFHSRLQAAAKIAEDIDRPPPGTLEEVREEARHCTRCALHCRATQTVFGEGPSTADIMIVGEQPGDQEDLAGRPFVGPAGRMFDAIAREVGFNREEAYVTNAVKHFKYEPRGKRRIHQKPNKSEVQMCKWWLRLELDLVKPKLVVALGATALSALTDDRQHLADLRGQTIKLAPDRSLLVTVHPSYLLRIPEEGRKQEEMARFRQDMARVAVFAQAAILGKELGRQRARESEESRSDDIQPVG